MFVLFLAACTPDDGGGFLSSSGRYENEAWGNTDTADTADTADTGEVGGEGAPVVTEVSLAWSEYPNYGIVLVATISFTDEGDDILGGVLFVDIFQPGDELAYPGILDIVDGAEVEEATTDTCYLMDDTLVFAIDNLDETEDTWMTIDLQDASGNISSTTEASIDGE